MASQAILLGLKTSKPTNAGESSVLNTAAVGITSKSNAKRTIISLGGKRKISAVSADPAKVESAAKMREAKRVKFAEEKDRQKLIVGVDFGCTYSGVSYVSTIDEHQDIQVLKEYSGGMKQSDLLEKVPTRIAYAAENDGKDAWGYMVKPGMVSYSWFKLLLDEDTEAAEHDDKLLSQSAGVGMFQLPEGKTPRDVTEDYLTYLYKHILTKLGEVIGKSMLAETPITFQFTLPALWSHRARDLTRDAASCAGFGTRALDALLLIDEPEAAAISAMKSTLDKFSKLNPFENGQGVVIVDLGGGTADLVSYRIVKTSPLQLEEICIGVGAKCGGTSIDRALHVLMGERYGDAFQNLPMSKIGPGSKFMEQFETVKRDFTDDDVDAEFELHLKLNELAESDEVEGYDFDTDEIKITAADMVDLFETAVNSSLDLVREQLSLIKKRKAPKVKTTILCGGLGSSPYMLKKFQEFCGGELEGNIEVVRPIQAWSAICRGAALRGLEKSPVLFRRSRYHYGFTLHRAFRQGKDREEDAFDDGINGKRAKNQMVWPVGKDEKIAPNAKKVYSCYYVVPADVTDFKPVEYLCMSTKDKAPTRKNSNVQQVAQISMHLTRYLKEERKRQKAVEGWDEEDSTELPIRLNIRLGSDKGVLEAYATARGKRVGSTTIHYEGNTVWERAQSTSSDEEAADTVMKSEGRRTSSSEE